MNSKQNLHDDEERLRGSEEVDNDSSVTQEGPGQDLFEILKSSAPILDQQNIAMIAFVLPLPFALGIPHHSTFMLITEEKLEALEGRQWLVSEDGPELPDFGSSVGVSLRV